MNVRTLLILVILGTPLGGCVLSGPPGCTPYCAGPARQSSSLVGFLYPDGSAPPRDNTIPKLPVPLRVGLAFLPSAYGGAGPSAAEKEALLERIRARFLSRKFIGGITVIPDYYLANGRGFAGLEGLTRLYDVDVVALVSYDQVTYANDMKYRSLAYLTIVGAFVVNGSEHDVTTLVDLAVVDPQTRSLLLRAGGTDSQHGVSTLIERGKDLRLASAGGLSAATDAMIEHFDLALAHFETDVGAGTARVLLVNRDGSARGGGGACGIAWTALLAASVLLARVGGVRRRRPA